MRYIGIVVCFASSIYAIDVQYQLQRLYMGLEELNVYTPHNTLSQEYDILLRNPRPIASRNHRIYNRLYAILHPWRKNVSTYLTRQDEEVVPIGTQPPGLSSEKQQELKNLAENVAHSRWLQFPLSCFYECDSQTCVLSRSRNPEYRDVYDRSVARHIIDAYEKITKGAPVHYVSIGSGGLLQELRILGLALRQKPNLRVVMHCIDPWFTTIAPQLIPYPKPHVPGMPIFNYQVNVSPSTQPGYFLSVLQKMNNIQIDIPNRKQLQNEKNKSIQTGLPQATMSKNANIRLYTYEYIGHYTKWVYHVSTDQVPLFPYPHIIASSDIEIPNVPGASHDILAQTEPLIENSDVTKAIYLIKEGEQKILTIVSQKDILRPEFRGFGIMHLRNAGLDKFQQEKARVYGQVAS